MWRKDCQSLCYICRWWKNWRKKERQWQHFWHAKYDRFFKDTTRIKHRFYSPYLINTSTEYDDGSSSSISSRKAGTSGCAFRHLDLRAVTVHNYLDDKVKPKKDEIIAALAKMNKDCGEWSLTNTCEHIATSIRYGEANATCKQVCVLQVKLDRACSVWFVFTPYCQIDCSHYTPPFFKSKNCSTSPILVWGQF